MTDQDINSLANVVEEKTLSNVNESTSNLVIDEPPQRCASIVRELNYYVANQDVRL